MARALFVNEVLADGQVGEAVGGTGGEETCGRPPRLTDTNAVSGGIKRAASRRSRLILSKPLRLASPAYVVERDLRELELLERIEELRVENLQLRGK